MFSVIIPLFNKSQYILRAIRSVLNQSFQEFEIIVVNDGSTDGGEKKVANEYDERVKLINQENKGVSEARNIGIAIANFEYIAFLDADDYWHLNYLEEIYKGLEKFPDTGIIGSSYSRNHEDLGYEDSKGWFQISDYFKKAIVNTLFFTSATVVKKSFFLQNSGFDNKLARGEDLDVWFRAVLFFGKPVYNFSKLVYYSQEDNEQATKQSFPLRKSLSFKILNEGYGHCKEIKDNLEFESFRKKYVYFNLFSYLSNFQNDDNARLLLEKLKGSFILSRLMYLLPFSLFRVVLKTESGRKLLRNYLKFCFRHIYKNENY